MLCKNVSICEPYSDGSNDDGSSNTNICSDAFIAKYGRYDREKADSNLVLTHEIYEDAEYDTNQSTEHTLREQFAVMRLDNILQQDYIDFSCNRICVDIEPGRWVLFCSK
jgi:hypothetical protein